ncbi:hypothetical protein NC652_027728 [Populus alba x Populus x berolinensis]|nr:hypothetical protein NC652_027728 [Populus alba x Populus x berolinensis]
MMLIVTELIVKVRIELCYSGQNLRKEVSKKPIVIGVVTSAAFLILLVMGVIYWKVCYGHKYTRERGIVKSAISSH